MYHSNVKSITIPFISLGKKFINWHEDLKKKHTKNQINTNLNDTGSQTKDVFGSLGPATSRNMRAKERK